MSCFNKYSSIKVVGCSISREGAVVAVSNYVHVAFVIYNQVLILLSFIEEILCAFCTLVDVCLCLRIVFLAFHTNARHSSN